MELTIEHLAPYLPYNLKVYDIVSKSDIAFELCCLCGNGYCELRNVHGKTHTDIAGIKPILRPLSQLTEEIEHGGRKFVPLNELWDSAECDAERDWIDQMRVINLEGMEDSYKVMYAPYTLMYSLISWHFDVFGLIDNGLAIENE